MRDVVEAGVAALERGGGESYNVATGAGTSINRIYALLKEGAGYADDATYGPARPGEVFKISLDASKAREGLGWDAAPLAGGRAAGDGAVVWGWGRGLEAQRID